MALAQTWPTKFLKSYSNTNVPFTQVSYTSPPNQNHPAHPWHLYRQLLSTICWCYRMRCQQACKYTKNPVSVHNVNKKFYTHMNFQHTIKNAHRNFQHTLKNTPITITVKQPKPSFTTPTAVPTRNWRPTCLGENIRTKDACEIAR
jgi:hypothetical protein